MARKLIETQELEYEFADVDPEMVRSVLADEMLFRELRRAAGDRVLALEIEVAHDRGQLRCQLESPARVPGFARKILTGSLRGEMRSALEVEWQRNALGYRICYQAVIGAHTGAVASEAFVLRRDGGCLVREQLTTTIQAPVFRRRILQHMTRHFRRMLSGDIAYGLTLIGREQPIDYMNVAGV